MSFEYIIEGETKVKKLNAIQEESLIKSITDNYKKYDRARSSNLDKSNSVIEEIFFKKNYSNTTDKSERWKSKIKMCKCYMFYQTLKAFIWKNVYSNVHNMFDVSGENHDSDNNSNKQKAVLTDILEKMDFPKTCDKVIDNALLYGELISFTAWKKKYQEYRRPVNFFKELFSGNTERLSKVLEASKNGQNFWIDNKKVYDNPYTYAVSPADLVFDSSQIDNWDSCPKIYRSFKTPDDIINNKFNTVSKETAQAIKGLLKENEQTDKSNNETVNGSTVEVLEHWGDIKLPSGELLKNWHVVIVGRKYLVRFHKNESIINPFTYGAFITDPDTKRGISPLYCILSLAKSQEEFLNRTINLQSLSENPPLLAPEGFFDEEEIALYPGKIIEYGDNLSSVSAFKQLAFNNNVFLADIEFLDTLMCEVSGIYPSMIGIQENNPKTATEINTKTQGQLTRLSMLLDIINQDFIIPNIKNIAKLCADFKQGDEEIFINQDNQPKTITITDEIRQADYKYTYSDRNMLNEKFAMADMVGQAVEKFAQILPLNIAEIFTWYFEQKGVENPERFLDQDKLEQQKQIEKVEQLMQEINMQNQLQQIELGSIGIPSNEVETQQEEISDPNEKEILSQIIQTSMKGEDNE